MQRLVKMLDQFWFKFGTTPSIESVFNECRTLTSPVDLAKCLLAIKENAFCASEYPVVITFEDHLTPDLQSKVAKVSNWELQYFHGTLTIL